MHAQNHHAGPWNLAVSATLHCLTGCAIGEILGMVIATAAGLGNLASIVLAIALAFVFGYGLTMRPLLPRFGRFATRYINPLTRPVAGKLPTFGIVMHTGRKTGRTYSTPVNVFRRGDEYFFFLTYGSEVQWVKNVLAAGSCSLDTRNQVVQ